MKQSKVIGITALLSVALLVAAVFMVTASVNQKDLPDPELALLGVKDPKELADLTREEIANLTKKGIPDFGPEVFEEMKKDPRVLDTYGTIPRFETDGERRDWLSNLNEIRKAVRSEMLPYFYPEGPVIVYGYNYRGYFMITIEENHVVEESLIDVIYGMINKEAKGMDIQEVPVVFKLGGFPELHRTRDDEFRPLIGGVQIQRVAQQTYGVSTLGFAAEDDGGNEGYVVSGHLGGGGDTPTPVGLEIWQPRVEGSYDVGEVERTGGTYADASWVPYDDVEAMMYICGGEDYEILRPVTDYREEPDEGDTVFKTGIGTDLRMGTVEGMINVNSPAHGTLYDQYYASYTSAGGDSGSPVYIYTNHYPDDPEREIVGINHGYHPDWGSFFFAGLWSI
jgi:streptogrisin B